MALVCFAKPVEESRVNVSIVTDEADAVLAILEKAFGRAKLIESMCDQRLLLPTYNAAAQKYNGTAKVPLATWSNSLIERMK